MYTTEEYIKMRYDRFGRGLAYRARNKEEHEAWYREAAARLSELLGLPRMMDTEPSPRKTSSRRYRGFVCERWELDTEPSVTMPFYLLVPDRPNGGAVINPHGHGGGKDENVGIVLRPGETADVSGEVHDAPDSFAAALARLGYCVAAPDARGSGERREGSHAGDGRERENSHREMLNSYISLGITPLSAMVWDLERLLDFVEALPYVDGGRIACAGMSGGGMQTLYLAALDRRVSAAITSGYFYGFRDALLRQPGNCGCNFVPGLYEYFDMGDIGAMAAPRPLFIESGTADGLNGASGIENVYSQVKIARAAYENFGAADRLVHSVHGGGHVFVGDGMAEFLAKFL